jgi:hypothetical protein
MYDGRNSCGDKFEFIDVKLGEFMQLHSFKPIKWNILISQTKHSYSICC